MQKTMTGGELLLELLKKENVDTIFGYPGGAIIPIFDELSKKANYFKFIVPRHEQGAVHAADAYARVTGKVGVCLVTSGPGATNTITGIANAYMDSIPIVVLTGQVPTSYIGTDAFQEVDMCGIVRPITKHRYLVKDVHDLPRIVKEAFYIASTGRPGPVVIDLPKDVTSAKISFDLDEEITINLRGYKPRKEGHPLQIKKLKDAIKEAKRPIAYIGGGVKLSHATEELREFLNKTNIPATMTLMALGTVDPNYKYNLEMLGMHGTVYANKSITESDLIIAIGARFDDRVTGDVSKFAPHAKIAHIDIDSSSISKVIKVDIPVVGDAKTILKELNKIVEPGDYKEWQEYVLKLKEENPMIIPEKKKGDKIRPQYLIKKLSDITEGKAYIATDVGQHQMWTAQFYKFSFENQFFTSGGLGTMGVGVPFGLGAAVGLKGKEPVIVISGDGSVQMNIQELATISLENLPVKIFILNNSFLGMVRQWQELFFNKKYSGTNLTVDSSKILTCEGPTCERPYIPDFKRLAEAYRIKAERISSEDEIEAAIKRALEWEGPYLIDFIIHEEENVFPMVPAGASLNEIIRGLA